MEVRIVTALLLLLQYSICCDAVSSNRSKNETIQRAFCKRETCIVSPDNFWRLQEIVSSNRLIILNSVELSDDRNIGFIVIENVSNLTISGGESGSIIQCSPHSAFGFHLKNTTNVKLTKLSIRNCGSAIPNNFLFQYVSFSCSSQVPVPTPPTLETSGAFLLFEDSKNTTLSRIYIEYSSGFALTVIDFLVNGEPMDNTVNHNLRLISCTISHSRVGSMMIYGTGSVLVERTVIANSTTGIVSYYADLTLKDVDFINCKSSYFGGGISTIRGQLTMNHSSLYARQHKLYIQRSQVLLYEDNSHLQFCRNSLFVIADNSVVVFTNPNLTVPLVDMWYSTILLHSSSLKFTENTASNTFAYAMVAFTSSQINMVNDSSLIVNKNLVTESGILIRVSGGSWKMAADCHVSIKDNIGFLLLGFANFSLGGLVRVENNSNHAGSLQIISSNVHFGRVEVVGNRAYGAGGGMAVTNSELFFTDTATFSDNIAVTGGAIGLSSSIVYVSPSAVVNFTRNFAYIVGGAISITNPRLRYLCSNSYISCSIQSLLDDSDDVCQVFSMTFNQNKAGVAGNAIYGGHKPPSCIPSNREETCYGCHPPDMSDLLKYNGVNDSSYYSSFTSDPTRVCFCENGIPDCYIQSPK